jgi:hypothetical protein
LPSLPNKTKVLRGVTMDGRLDRILCHPGASLTNPGAHNW